FLDRPDLLGLVASGIVPIQSDAFHLVLALVLILRLDSEKSHPPIGPRNAPYLVDIELFGNELADSVCCSLGFLCARFLRFELRPGCMKGLCRVLVTASHHQASDSPGVGLAGVTRFRLEGLVGIEEVVDRVTRGLNWIRLDTG